MVKFTSGAVFGVVRPMLFGMPFVYAREMPTPMSVFSRFHVHTRLELGGSHNVISLYGSGLVFIATSRDGQYSEFAERYVSVGNMLTSHHEVLIGGPGGGGVDWREFTSRSSDARGDRGIHGFGARRRKAGSVANYLQQRLSHD